MPASFAPLVFPNGIPPIHCPVTGRVVLDDEGIAGPLDPQSPHVRFIIDWIGDTYVAQPEDVPPDQTAYQQALVHMLANDDDRFENQNELVAACAALMPESALVLELLEPPQGSYEGQICYVGLDLARIDAEVEAGGERQRESIQLVELL